MGTMAYQITSLTIVYSTVYSGADQRKHQSSASLAFVWGIHRWPVNSPHKGPVTRKMFPFDDVITNFSQSHDRLISFFNNGNHIIGNKRPVFILKWSPVYNRIKKNYEQALLFSNLYQLNMRGLIWINIIRKCAEYHEIAYNPHSVTANKCNVMDIPGLLCLPKWSA